MSSWNKANAQNQVIETNCKPNYNFIDKSIRQINFEIKSIAI